MGLVSAGGALAQSVPPVTPGGIYRSAVPLNPEPAVKPRYQFDRTGAPIPAAPRRYNDTCLTSRGSCTLERPQPVGTSCSCEIEGFGVKRGQVP